jgi:hypothetical protein
MAESSVFWTTNNTGDGTSSGYTQAQLFQVMRSFARTANLGGVCPDVLNELAVTGTSSPVAVNTGQALVYGIPYFNSASVNVTIATPASLTRVDYIVLRASYAAQTVRITRIAGTEGAGAPSLTQVAGTTWDIPLATASITTGGVITVTDAREWTNGIGDLTVDSTKLAANAVTNAKLNNMAANTVKANNTAGSTTPSDVDIATLLAAYIHAATEKSTPVAADEVALIDSAASNALKRATLTDLLVGLVTVSTFTPAILINASATGITYSTQSGVYAQMGKLIFYAIRIVLSSKGGSSGSVTLSGFPATVKASGQFDADAFFDNANQQYGIKLRLNNADTKGTLWAFTASGSAALANTGINNNFVFEATGWYLTD